MPTKRTTQDIFGQFEPGQPAGVITPDRVQDAVFSVLPGFGRISLSAQTETSIATQDDWVKVAGTTVLGDGAFTFSMPQNNRLQCNCPVPSRLIVDAALSFTNGSQKNFEVALAKGNGDDPPAILDISIQALRFGPGGGAVEIALLGDFIQAQGDFVEVWIRNTTDNTNATCARLYMRAMTFVL
jgi:hypothetical protein